MKELRRTKVDNFNIENAVKIDFLEKIENKESVLISIEELFKKQEKIVLNDKKVELFFNGVKLSCDRKDGIYRIYHKDIFLGIGIIKDNLLKRDIII